jgi:hypothetical protein
MAFVFAVAYADNLNTSTNSDVDVYTKLGGSEDKTDIGSVFSNTSRYDPMDMVQALVNQVEGHSDNTLVINSKTGHAYTLNEIKEVFEV